MYLNEIDNSKLSLTNNRFLKIINYKKINYLSLEKIIIDKYIIKGDDLKVKDFDGYTININGIIKEIVIDEIYS